MDRLSPHRSFVLPVISWYVVILLSASAVAYALEAGLLAWKLFALGLIAYFLIGVAQYALVQAAHHAAHVFVHRGGWRGNLSAVFLFYALGFTPSFRALHLRHHRFFGDPVRDPDHVDYSRSPNSRAELICYIAQGMSGYSGMARFLSTYLRPPSPLSAGPIERDSASGRHHFVKLVLTQAVIAGTFAALTSPWLYPLLWVLPILTLGKTLNNLRLCAEHGFSDGQPILRGFRKTSLLSHLIAPFGFEEHVEHHLYPEIDDLDLRALRGTVDPDSEEVRRRARGARVEYFGGTHFRFLTQRFSKKLPNVARVASELPRA